MLEIRAGYPMLVKNASVKIAIEALKVATSRAVGVFADHDLTIFLTVEGDGLNASEFSDMSLIVLERDYLDAEYLRKRKPRSFDGKIQGPRRDSVFREPIEVLDSIQDKFLHYSEQELDLCEEEVRSSVDSLFEDARDQLRS